MSSVSILLSFVCKLFVDLIIKRIYDSPPDSDRGLYLKAKAKYTAICF